MALKEDILNKIIERAAQLFQKGIQELSAATRFEEDLQAKSVNYAQITTILEAEFDVEIPYMEFKRRKTFGEAAEYVKQLVEG